ncbi:MAG: recombinase family protein, partial [Betaproteobacteria bacterium]|nr:recombinase family protein [Betaproteobacteria bacterium]
LFEQHGVALVSVTQSLDTTDLHGRLALNLLTSFAQFERELIGERSREKRAATRRQGVWYGNAPPLGYTLVRQRLVVDPKEAEVVRSIFTGFVEQDAVTALIKDLADRGIMSGMHQTCRFKRSTSATKAGVNSAISVSMSRTWC